MNPLELGRWEGDTFVFDEPFIISTGAEVRKLVVGPDALGPGVSRDDALHVFVNVFVNGVQDPFSELE